MTATLGILLKKVMPEAHLHIYERLDLVAAESSDAWNNAGTGHSAFCELNYTPEREDGSVDIEKALQIAERFEISKQFWAYLKEEGHLSDQTSFINDIDHMSFVWGEENVSFLQKRHETMTPYPIFEDMLISEDLKQITEWVPLMMEGRAKDLPVAATRMAIGTDVNFGLLTRQMISYLQTLDGVYLHLGHEVENISRNKNGKWQIEVRDVHGKYDKERVCDCVFIGAGGGSLPLLEKSDIPEGRGYGGFPVSGQFLRCSNPDVIGRHEAKVYGKAPVGSPPMSVPHLDTRMLDGERSLLFGPYAGFSTKFLKNGSYLDLPLSIEMHNVWPMLSAGIQNIALTKYLIKQVIQSPEDRFTNLTSYFPNAQMKDWDLVVAGQRVQIIKKNKKEGGMLKFGTEVVSSQDRTLAALLGASPGASTSVSIMIDVLATMFPAQMPAWNPILREMIPTHGQSLIKNGNLCRQTRSRTTALLQIHEAGN
ncbi:UNVERIFIED_CONTAM: hypothetical protein GTU68_009183 [Idotea baltica]|nr:hypothetical protein [Idotea baltica]